MLPGFHKITSATYHLDPCIQPSLSSSIAQILLRQSARKAWFSHPRLNKNFREEHDDKFDLGTAAHAALLEGSLGVEVIDPALYPSKTGSVPDGWTNNAIRAARDAARLAGKTPILKRHYDDVENMVGAALSFIADSEIAEYWEGGESELTGVWQEDGLWMRCRFDHITKDRRTVIVDYKSTTDASPDGFGRQIIRMGYHIQESFYRRGAAALGCQAPHFIFLAQSCELPYECSLHGCDPALQEIADAEVERAVDLWRQCMTRKSWPSYGGRIHWAIPTTWMMNDHESKLAEAA